MTDETDNQGAPPWTQEQVDGLNDYQRHGYMHPFTCGSGKRGNKAHREYAKENGDRDEGLLVATINGWVCPVCSYTQDWAHVFMFAGRGKNPFDAFKRD